MNVAALLTDAYGRVLETTRAVLDGLTVEELAHRPGPEANSIGWLVWHLARVQDDHVAALAGVEQRWTAEGFAARFALPYDDADIGYGQTPGDVAAYSGAGVTAPDLMAYLEAVHSATVSYLATLGPDDLDEVVDERWDPPVTRGVRLVSVVDDDAQHVGQAAYVRGLLESSSD
ncbi:MAG: hypothetical protein CMH83_15180 [Nocardioides sp.]|nr:hypothetical protein [Nocardioides sp.]